MKDDLSGAAGRPSPTSARTPTPTPTPTTHADSALDVAPSAEMTDLILYTNIPFCTSKCHFCLWVAQAEPAMLTRNRDRFKQYTQAVLREQRQWASRLSNLPVQVKCIYFGGGTPSIVDAEDLAPLVQTLLTDFRHGPDFETATIECSPQTLSFEKLRDLRAIGFDRISMGVQSFDDERLRRQARAHTGKQAIDAYEFARAAGFENINLDLIVGLPEESFEEWQVNLRHAVELQPDHLSIYIYKPFPGTTDMRLIQAGKLALPSPDDTIRRFRWTEDLLARHGYEHYQHQLFTRNGKVCNSDSGYFNLTRDWIGFGAGAHSLFQQDIWNHPNRIHEYIGDPLSTPLRSPIRRFPDHLWGSAWQALHTRRGIHFATWERRFGATFHETRAASHTIDHELREMEDRGFLNEDAEGIRIRDWDSLTLLSCERQTRLISEGSLMPTTDPLLLARDAALASAGHA